MIEFNKVTLQLNRKQILSDISAVIPDDCKTVIIGKSGCGKTVFMKTLEGLYRPQSGMISIDSETAISTNIPKRPEVLSKVAMVFQNAALLDSFTVYQNVALPLYEKKNKKPDEIQSEVMEILSFVGLQDSAEHYPSELSGGMRKRIGLARALITNPKYVILDEPTTGLDPSTANDVMMFLKQVIELKKVIPITITHDPYCINELGDFIIMMDEGKVLFSGYKTELQKLYGTEVLNFYNSFFQL
jgi:phospholipid/cholesterol/gamma-HCH transport system ATP-binding protein